MSKCKYTQNHSSNLKKTGAVMKKAGWGSIFILPPQNEQDGKEDIILCYKQQQISDLAQHIICKEVSGDWEKKVARPFMISLSQIKQM